MKLFAGAFVTATFVAVSLAFATETPVPPPPETPQSTPATPEPPKEDKVVCQKIKVTGSRLATEKICKKQSEWDADAEEAKRAYERGLSNQSTRDNPGGRAGQ